MRRRRPDSDFHAEIESHIRLEADRLMAEGMPPKEAEAAARRAFGNAGAAAEQFYFSQRWLWWDDIRRDVRFGLRSLAKSPTFTAAVAITVALGVGVNTAIFSLLDAVILRTLPVSDPSTLVFVRTAEDRATGTLPYRAFLRMRDHMTEFSGLAAFATDELRVEYDGRPEPVNGQIVSGDYFSVLGVRMALGRSIARGDEKLDPPVAVISHRYWRNRFQADPAVAGRTFAYAGRTYTIVGVTAPGFEGLRPGFAVDLSLPISPELSDRLGGHELVARLRPGVTRERAASASTALVAGVLRELGIPESRIRERFRVVELWPAGRGADVLRMRFAKPLYVLMGIAALVLLLAAANIANLLLARGLARGREFAIRLATGASRLRLVRQLAAETLLLFVCGAVPGVAAAAVGVSFIEGMFAEGRRSIAIGADLNWRVLGFALAVTLGVGLLAALIPAWRVFRSDLEQVIRDAQTRSSESRASALPRQALVALQVAVSLVLLVTGVTFAGTLVTLRDVDPGFGNGRVLTMSVELPEGYVQAGKSGAIWDGVAAAVRRIPGVESAGVSTFTPFSQRDRWRPVEVRGYVPASDADRLIHFNHVSEGYFETLGVPLMAGRLFTEADAEAAARVAIVNESAVEKFFAGLDPVGRSVRFDQREYRIVGVVRDTKHNSLREPAVPFVFLPLRQALYPERRVTLSVAGVQGVLLDAIRRQVAGVDSGLMISEVISLESLAESTLLTERLLSGIASAFGVLGLILASVGLYGVLSYRVSQQRVSIGIRIALGASPAAVARGVMRQSGLMVLAGICCGLPVAVVAVRAASTLLWGVRPGDPAVYLAVAGVLAAIGLASAWLPARRASGIQPAEALRHN